MVISTARLMPDCRGLTVTDATGHRIMGTLALMYVSLAAITEISGATRKMYPGGNCR